jgi:hypothetical protein
MPSIIDKATASVARNWAKVTSHFLFFGGITVAIYGFHLIYPPLGYIAGGAAAFWIARLMEMERSEPRS